MHLQFFARHLQPVAFDTHLAARHCEVVGQVVSDAVGLDQQVAAAKLDITFGLGVEVGPASQLLRLHDHRQLFGGVTLRRRLQPAARLQRRGRRGRRHLGPEALAAQRQAKR